jgi:hypothetical protein
VPASRATLVEQYTGRLIMLRPLLGSDLDQLAGRVRKFAAERRPGAT